MKVVASARDNVWSGRGGDEDEFWEAARGLAAPPGDAGPPPSLAYCLVPQSASLGSELKEGEAPLFGVKGSALNQSSLDEKAIMIVPHGKRVFVWSGRSVASRTASAASKVALHWAEATAHAASRKTAPRQSRALPRTYSFDPAAASEAMAAASDTIGLSDRKATAPEIVPVRQGAEPSEFTGLFHGWCRWDAVGRGLSDPRATRVASRAAGTEEVAQGKVVATVEGGDSDEEVRTERGRSRGERTEKARRARSKSAPSMRGLR